MLFLYLITGVLINHFYLNAFSTPLSFQFINILQSLDELKNPQLIDYSYTKRAKYSHKHGAMRHPIHVFRCQPNLLQK